MSFDPTQTYTTTADIEGNVFAFQGGRYYDKYGNSWDAIPPSPLNGYAAPTPGGGASSAGQVLPSVDNVAANQNQTKFRFSHTVETTQTRSTGSASRVVWAEPDRVRTVVKNPITNTVSFEFGSTTNTNDNANPPGTFGNTLAPGQDFEIDLDNLQWYFRQAATGVAVATQPLTIEVEYYA